MVMLHSWVDVIKLPSGRLTLMGFQVICLLVTLVVSMTKMDDAPVSAMVWLGRIRGVVLLVVRASARM